MDSDDYALMDLEEQIASDSTSDEDLNVSPKKFMSFKAVLDKYGVMPLDIGNGHDRPLYFAPHRLRDLRCQTPSVPKLVIDLFDNAYEKCILRHFGEFVSGLVKSIQASTGTSNTNVAIPSEKELLSYLVFPEIPFFKTGFCERGYWGCGLNEKDALAMFERLKNLVSNNLDFFSNEEHQKRIFKVFHLFNTGIGVDKIGDAFGCLLLPQLLVYSDVITKKILRYSTEKVNVKEWTLEEIVSIASKGRDGQNFDLHGWSDPEKSFWTRLWQLDSDDNVWERTYTLIIDPIAGNKRSVLYSFIHHFN